MTLVTVLKSKGKSPEVYICRKNGYFLRLPHHVTFFEFLTIFILKGPTVH